MEKYIVEHNERVDKENKLWDEIIELEQETAQKRVEIFKKMKEIWNEKD